jgi:hypothetical protein
MVYLSSEYSVPSRRAWRAAIIAINEIEDEYFLQRLRNDPLTFTVDGRFFAVAIEPNMLAEIQRQCRQNRFVVFALSVAWYHDSKETGGGREFSGHANGLLVDTLAKTYERYEPNGHHVETEFWDKVLEKFVEVDMPRVLPGYTYRSPREFCPRFGLQSRATSTGKGGYCVAWSAFYVHSRVLNPGFSARQVQDLLLQRYTPDRLTLMIRRYIGWMDAVVPDLAGEEANYEYLDAEAEEAARRSAEENRRRERERYVPPEMVPLYFPEHWNAAFPPYVYAEEPSRVPYEFPCTIL